MSNSTDIDKSQGKMPGKKRKTQKQNEMKCHPEIICSDYGNYYSTNSYLDPENDDDLDITPTNAQFYTDCKTI